MNLLFDLDGTLTDSKPGIFSSVTYALHKFGIEHAENETLCKFLGPPLLESFQKHFGFSQSDAELAVEYYREYYIKEGGICDLTVYSGVKEMLRYLKNRNYNLYVATAKPQVYAKEILERENLASLFLDICGASLTEERSRKHQVIAYVMKKHNLKSGETIMIGDRRDDVLGAEKNEIATVGVLYGYGSEDELKEAGCEKFIKNPMDIKKYF